MLDAVVTGLAPVPVLSAKSARGKSPNQSLIRPPGALDEADVLSRRLHVAFRGECQDGPEIKIAGRHLLRETLLRQANGSFFFLRVGSADDRAFYWLAVLDHVINRAD